MHLLDVAAYIPDSSVCILLLVGVSCASFLGCRVHSVSLGWALDCIGCAGPSAKGFIRGIERERRKNALRKSLWNIFIKNKTQKNNAATEQRAKKNSWAVWYYVCWGYFCWNFLHGIMNYLKKPSLFSLKREREREHFTRIRYLWVGTLFAVWYNSVCAFVYYSFLLLLWANMKLCARKKSLYCLFFMALGEEVQAGVVEGLSATGAKRITLHSTNYEWKRKVCLEFRCWFFWDRNSTLEKNKNKSIPFNASASGIFKF